MGNKSRDEKKAIILIDGMINVLSGGSDNSSTSNQGMWNNTFHLQGEDINGDFLRIDNTVDTGDIDFEMDHQLERYQIISLFAEVGRLVSADVEENEDDIKDKLASLVKIGSVAGFADSVLSIADHLNIEIFS